MLAPQVHTKGVGLQLYVRVCTRLYVCVCVCVQSGQGVIVLAVLGVRELMFCIQKGNRGLQWLRAWNIQCVMEKVLQVF